VESRIRDVVRQTAPDIVPRYITLAEHLAASQTDRRFTTLILTAFALISLALAGVGIYGVVSYTAAQRTREMGIRLALGAAPGQVRRLVQNGAMAQVGAGLLFGLLAALAATQLMRSLLYEVGTTDPVALGTAAGLLVVVAWLASWLPAWRAARLDPMLTIRTE
jgi:ABC-type antimicrobial peptide transport system permease subunit